MLALVVVFLTAVVLYLLTLGYDFTGWDDTAYIMDNPHMKHVGGLMGIWFSRENEAYYPLTFTAMWIQYQWFGVQPLGYHAVCILLHAVNVAFLLVVLRRLKIGETAAFIAAMLFAVHPVQVMTAAFIAEQKNLIACFCVLLCMYSWLNAHAGSRAWYVAALASYAGAVLAKSAMLGLPIGLLALDVCVLQKGVAASVKRILPMIVVAGLSALLTVLFEQKFVDPGDATGIPPLVERVLLAATAPWWYIAHLALPINLSPFYPLWDIARSDWRWWIGLAVWVVLAGVLIAKPRATVGGAIGWVVWALIFFAMLLGPSLGLIPFGNMHATYVSDHFLYVASIGPVVVIGMTLGAVASRWKPAVVLVGAIILALSAQTLMYMPTFRNEMSFWERSHQHSPDNYVTNFGLAVAHMNKAVVTGDPQPRLIARTLLERAQAIQPRMSDAYFHAGENELELGDLVAAEHNLRRCLDLNPNFARASELLGVICERSGRPDEALSHFETAARLDPRNDRAILGLGRMYLGFARHDAAEPVFRRLVDLRPNFGMGYVGVATCLRAKGQWGAAAQFLQDGLDPTNNDVAVQSMLALIYSTAPDPQVRNGVLAVSIMEGVVAKIGRTNVQVLDTLAAAYAEAGRFDEAVRVSDEAVGIAEQAGNRTAADESRRRSGLYRQSQPLRP